MTIIIPEWVVWVFVIACAVHFGLEAYRVWLVRQDQKLQIAHLRSAGANSLADWVANGRTNKKKQ